MEWGRQRSIWKVTPKQVSMLTKGNMTAHSLALGRLVLAASSKGRLPPLSRDISLVKIPCVPSGGLMEQSSMLEQSLARVHNAPKTPHWRLSPEPQGQSAFGCSERFGLKELALPPG